MQCNGGIRRIMDNDILSMNSIRPGHVILFDDDIRALVLDVDDDEMYVYTENGCVEKIHKSKCRATNDYVDIVDRALKYMQHGCSDMKGIDDEPKQSYPAR